MLRVAEAIPDVQVVDACEQVALDRGRQLLRDSLGDAIQAGVDAAEKRGGPSGLRSRRGPQKGDDGKVDTTQGWRDVKSATFARRERALLSESAGYEQRDLPAPSTRAVVAEDFGHRCQVEAMRLHRLVLEPLSLLGDGAEWIWTLHARRFDQAQPVLDVFHAVEYLAELARALWGGDEVSARKWLDGARRALVGRWLGRGSATMWRTPRRRWPTRRPCSGPIRLWPATF